MTVLRDQNREEPVLKYVTVTFPGLIVPLAIARVDVVHPFRQIVFGRLQEKVIVISHDAPGIHGPIKCLGRTCQQINQSPLLGRPLEDHHVAVAMCRHMIDAVGNPNSSLSTHSNRPSARTACLTYSLPKFKLSL